MTPLNQDFREFIELLERHAVDYLVVGGYADKENLLRNKAATGRSKDRIDLDALS